MSLFTNNFKSVLQRIEQLNSIGIALSAERDTDQLLEMILLGAQSITNADGGSLYTVTDDKQRLVFEIVRTKSKNISLGGTSGDEIPFAPLSLYDATGKPNNHTIVAYSVLNDKMVNIPDAYAAEGFDFSGTRAFDKLMGYKSMSFLTIPMKNHENEIIGVLQLINKLDPKSKKVLPFTKEDEQLAQSLASQAAVTLTKNRLIDNLKNLFESFIQLIATAIDEKSPYTGGHCKRVPILTMMLAKAVSEVQEGPFKDFKLTSGDIYELETAAWLHDCGKITTPEYIVDKATKLETIFDRINLVDARFEILKRDEEIKMLRKMLSLLDADYEQKITDARPAYNYELKQLKQDRDFLHQCNVGGEFMSEDLQKRVRSIALRKWNNMDGDECAVLTDNELENLNIVKGTLTPEERKVINHHITATINMLNSLPFPKHLKNVPEYAGGHHERMDGKGYPLGLTRDQMSVQARIMAIADIFEALTAADRPYKKAKPLSEALKILQMMKQDSHIDPDLFDIFIEKKVYREYADKFLAPEQIDVSETTETPDLVTG